MRRFFNTANRRRAACFVLFMAVFSLAWGPPRPAGADDADGPDKLDGPGGTSRYFHVDCGLNVAGNPPWQKTHDRATTADGYRYTVDGNSYHGGGADDHCWFFNTTGRVTIECPPRASGTLYLYCFDMNSNHRRQMIAVCGGEPVEVRDFMPPDGRWVRFPIDANQTADGRITIDIQRTAGANAVISRVDFIPSGVPNPVITQAELDKAFAASLIEDDWATQERQKGRTIGSTAALTALLTRGRQLLDDLQHAGAITIAAESRAALDEIERRASEPSKNHAETRAELYRDARTVIRRAMFAHPAIDFDELLFVRRFTPSIGHQCSHHVGSAQRPGGDLCVLKGLRPGGEVRSLIGDRLPTGAIGRPDLDFDAKRIVFPYAAPRSVPTAYPYGRPGKIGGACVDYQLCEIDLDSGALKRLTDGPGENTEPCYLPDGRIAFTSSRCNRFVQCGDWAIVFSLYAMQRDGSDVRPLTVAKEGEWFPSVLADGRLIYMRWEYVIKAFNTIQYLWSVYPDGTRASLAFGDHYAYSPGPLAFIEARQIPGTSRVVCTGAAHHNCGVGPIVTVDLAKNRGPADGLVRITPDVLYPETTETSMRGSAPSPAGYYNAPYPLTENLFLVCYSPEPAHNAPTAYGIYLLDSHGNRELVYRTRDRSCYSPIPLRPRDRPPVIGTPVIGTPISDAPAAANDASSSDRPTGEGTLLLADVYEGLDDVPRGTVRYLRVLETLPKSSHSDPQRLDIGVGSGWDPRRVLGVVRVEADGSACFRVPADRAIFFQALDAEFRQVRGMRSYMSTQPGETVACVGCHEPYNHAPKNVKPVAMTRRAQQIEPPPWGDQRLSFPQVIQPILDRKCTSCHDGSTEPRHGFDLTPTQRFFPRSADNHLPGYAHHRDIPYLLSRSYATLLKYVDTTKLSGYGGGNLPIPTYGIGSPRSKLVEVVRKGHYDVKLTEGETRAISAWIDTNAPYFGHWEELETHRPVD